jgi:hypothetical protein
MKRISKLTRISIGQSLSRNKNKSYSPLKNKE